MLLWNVWAHLPHRLSSLTNDRHVWFFGLVLCVDWDASYSSQVAYVTCRLCPNQWIILLNNRELCYRNTNKNLTITRLGCSYKQFHVAPPGEWYSMSFFISVTTLFHSHKWWVCLSQHWNNLLIYVRLQYNNTNVIYLKYIRVLVNNIVSHTAGATLRLLLARDYSWPAA